MPTQVTSILYLSYSKLECWDEMKRQDPKPVAVNHKEILHTTYLSSYLIKGSLNHENMRFYIVAIRLAMNKRGPFIYHLSNLLFHCHFSRKHFLSVIKKDESAVNPTTYRAWSDRFTAPGMGKWIILPPWTCNQWHMPHNN